MCEAPASPEAFVSSSHGLSIPRETRRLYHFTGPPPPSAPLSLPLTLIYLGLRHLNRHLSTLLPILHPFCASKMPPRDLPPRSSGRSLKKTKVIINVYDLLPPGRLSSFVWTIGCGLLHSGVVINEREYAFGGHDRRGLTGVYWTKPKTEPPGGTFRSEILHGFTYASDEEIEDIVREVLT